MPSDDEFLLLSLKQAQLGKGQCAPNPAVGAVVVKENEVISLGYHKGAGRAHAEVEALSVLNQAQGSTLVGGQAQDSTNVSGQAQGSTVYVTLEPCCHFGKTPPCTRYLIEMGVKRVVYGYEDPNPLVKGKGALALKEAGVEVVFRPLPEISAFYESYAYWTRTKQPRVTLKLAMSLDGKIAPEWGRRYQLTGEVAARLTHEERLKSDALLTTVKTIRADDPQFNVRLTQPPTPKKVYVLGKETIPTNAQIFKTAKEVIPVSGDLESVLAQIGRDGVHDLWVEAGPTLSGQLLKSQLVHRALFYVAPLWLGKSAVPALEESQDWFARAKSREGKGLGQDAYFEVLW